jgi:hypothetical protein
VWVSSEVREEIEEILAMLATAQHSFSEIRVDAPVGVLATMTLPRVVNGAKVVAASYRHQVGINLRGKVAGLFSFAWRVTTRRPRLVFSGFSMLKHRVVSAVARVPHVSYLRGAMFDPSITGGYSDAAAASGMAKFLPHRVFHSYSADAVLTVGEVNRRFLLGRGIPSESIHLVGPVWLRDVEPASDRAVAAEPGTAYFLTTAWRVHGKLEEHEAQLAITRRLAADWPGPRRLVLRVHPRDDYSYESDPVFQGVPLNRLPPGEFLGSLDPGDVLIAPLSTFAFEAMQLGYAVVFYADPVATKAYLHMYSALGIAPKSVDDLIAGDLTRRRESIAEIFSPVDVGQLDEALTTLLDHPGSAVR